MFAFLSSQLKTHKFDYELFDASSSKVSPLAKIEVLAKIAQMQLLLAKNFLPSQTRHSLYLFLNGERNINASFFNDSP